VEKGSEVMKVYVAARTRAGACEHAVILRSTKFVGWTPAYPTIIKGDRLFEVELRAKLYRPKKERAKRRKKS
jgi:hypothetical protein